MEIYGRTSIASRQAAAEALAAITETVTLTKETDKMWRADYTITHRIVPIKD